MWRTLTLVVASLALGAPVAALAQAPRSPPPAPMAGAVRAETWL
jgi:hypothetical protein